MSKPISPAPTAEFLADAALRLIAAAPGRYVSEHGVDTETAVFDAVFLFYAAAEAAGIERREAENAALPDPPGTSAAPRLSLQTFAVGAASTVTKNAATEGQNAVPNQGIFAERAAE